MHTFRFPSFGTNRILYWWLLVNSCLLLLPSHQFAEKESTKPLTPYQNEIELLVRKITEENNMYLYSVRFFTHDDSAVSIDSWMGAFGKSHALISGNNITSLQTGSPVVVVFFLRRQTVLPQDDLNLTLYWIRTICHRQRDHFLFIGDRKNILKLWNTHEINQLRNRWAFATDSKEFMGRSELNPFTPVFCPKIEQFSVRNKYAIASNVRGRHLKISGWAHVPPYHFITGLSKKGMPVYDGSNVRLFKEASPIFNFTFELVSDEEASSYGVQLENGSWTGMIGAVNSGAYDAALFLGPTLIWYPMFDFVGSLSGAAIRFMVPKPTSEIRWEWFLHPFRVSLWMALIVLFLVVWLTILSLLYLTTFISKAPFGSKTPIGCCSLITTSTFLTFQIAMEQTAHIPKGARVVCGAWVIFSIIVGTAYKSQVMSSLTFPFTEKPPNTYLELAHHKEYKSILNNIGGLEVSYFQSNDSQLISTIAKRLTYKPVPMDCIKKAILYPKTVCIGWFPFLEYIMAEWASPDAKISPSLISEDPALQVVVAVAFQKYSPFSQGFAPIIHGFWESGIYRVWENDVLRIHKKKGVSNYKESPGTLVNRRLKSIVDDIVRGNEETPLKVSNMKMMFIILVSGIFAAIGICMLENVLHYKQKRHQLRTAAVTVIKIQSKL